MKRRIDLEKAGEAEAFGALAVRHRRKHRRSGASRLGFTAAQIGALSELACSFVQIAKEAGARRKRIRIGEVSFELQESGNEEVLSIRTALAP